MHVSMPEKIIFFTHGHMSGGSNYTLDFLRNKAINTCINKYDQESAVPIISFLYLHKDAYCCSILLLQERFIHIYKI